MNPLLEAEIARTLAALQAPAESELAFDKHEWLERVKARPVQDGDLLLICVDPATEAMIAKRQVEFMAAWKAGTLPDVSEGPILRAAERQAAWEASDLARAVGQGRAA